MSELHLLMRARALIDEALWAHIYDEENAEEREAAVNSAYADWLYDFGAYLIGKEANDVVSANTEGNPGDVR
jgi:transcription elongation GreA/GreB family factor